MPVKVRSRMVIWSALVAAACDSVTAPPLAICNLSAVAPQALQVGQYRAIDPGLTQGCVVFPANMNSDSAEYLLVPQATTETPDLTSTFKLFGGAAAMAAPLIAAAVQRSPLSPPERFHQMLRELERTGTYPGAEGGAAAHPQVLAPAAVAPPVLGERRRFKVLSSITRVMYDSVTAYVQSVGQHIAIYVDSAAPPGGLTVSDLNALRDAFDQNLYPADTAAFGRESDIAETCWIVLFHTVNKWDRAMPAHRYARVILRGRPGSWASIVNDESLSRSLRTQLPGRELPASTDQVNRGFRNAGTEFNT